MNKFQEIFNTVYLGLAGQNFVKSYDKEADSCRYRYEGLKCAAGHLVPDEEYNRDWDEVAVPKSVMGISWFVRNFSEAELNLIYELQQHHDYSTSSEDIKERLIIWAEKYNLEIPSNG